MYYREEFKKEFGYDAYAYDNNKDGEPRIVGFCENYVEWLEDKVKNLQHYRDTTLGLYATDRKDLVEDKQNIMFQLS